LLLQNKAFLPKTPPPEPEEEILSVKHSVAQVEEEDIPESPKSLSQQTPKEEVATEENRLEEEEATPQNE
jgi:hypothetical protein